MDGTTRPPARAMAKVARGALANVAVVPLLAIALALYATAYINALAHRSPWIYRLVARRAGERPAGTDSTAVEKTLGCRAP